MRPAQHPSNQTVLRPPPGASVQECVVLPITNVVDGNGRACVQSYWRPSLAEREAIAAGSLVLFNAWGTTHPPVWIGVEGIDAE